MAGRFQLRRDHCSIEHMNPILPQQSDAASSHLSPTSQLSSQFELKGSKKDGSGTPPLAVRCNLHQVFVGLNQPNNAEVAV